MPLTSCGRIAYKIACRMLWMCSGATLSGTNFRTRTEVLFSISAAISSTRNQIIVLTITTRERSFKIRPVLLRIRALVVDDARIESNNGTKRG